LSLGKPANVEVHPPAETSDERRRADNAVPEAVNGNWRAGCNKGYGYPPPRNGSFSLSAYSANRPDMLVYENLLVRGDQFAL
jgi:hypothetical protein